MIVVVELATLELGQIELRPRERRHRRGRRQHQIAIAEIGLEAAEDAGLLGVRPGRILEAHFGAGLVVGAHVRPERRGVLVVGGLVAGDEVLCAHDIEASVGLAEVEAHLVT